MSDDAFPIGDRALYDRLKAQCAGVVGDDVAPRQDEDLMSLAAWMEHRAAGGSHDEESALTQDVEAMLFADPTLLDDVLALTPPLPSDQPSSDFLTRAQALVQPPTRTQIKPAPAAVVVPFRLTRPVPSAKPQKPRSIWLAWSALAACLACISIVGFNMGIEAEHNIDTSTDQMSIDILDAPNAVIDGTS